MNNEVFLNISKIIERDSKSTTYKFALLRGVIDIIQDNSPYIRKINDKVEIPLGLLVEKWMVYYYPILESTILIPQINGASKLAFNSQLLKIIHAYKERGGFSAFYNDLKNKGIPKPLQPEFLNLANKIRNTITQMPMKYIGRSISDDYYSIFQFQTERKRQSTWEIDMEYLILTMGTFTLPKEYFDAFTVLGSFINGQDSILFKWAEFSSNASGNTLKIESVVEEVLKAPVTERDVKHSKQIYKQILDQEGSVYCVWSGEKIRQYDIDHMIPFSVWKNNDLWNLLPAKPKINLLKKDKIPSPGTIDQHKELILRYWNLINAHTIQHHRFQKEIQVALLGNDSIDFWQTNAIEQLKRRCESLISDRGYQEWKF